VPVQATVVVVDDHAAFRAAARDLLEADGFIVVGEAADGSAALALVEELEPDIVLLDIRLPDADGFEVAKWIATRRDPPDVVLVSSRDASVYGHRLAGAACRGFLAKADLTGAALRRLLAS
jgi:DNA-binding NarL/FixJ family response regulator